MTNQSGIYCITNTVNGNKYIGSAVNIKVRWQKHQRDLNNNVHHSKYLQNAWNKYGADCFEVFVLERCELERLIEREQVYIDNEQPVYNVCPKAGSCLGIKRSEEFRRNISERMSGELNQWFGKQFSEEHRRKIGEASKGRPSPMKGKHHDEVTKQKISDGGRLAWQCRPKTRSEEQISKFTFSGKHHTEEAKQKISEANSGENHYNFGKHPSEETLLKMSKASLGRKVSEETKQKLAAANKGEKNRLYGKHQSDETKRKLSESLRKYYEERKNAAA